MQFGCQTYTWQMSYDTYKNKLGDILTIIKKAGFGGVETEVCMLGNYYNHPQQLKEDLDQLNIQLAALTLALPWQKAAQTEEERRECRRLLKFLKHFPQTKLILVQLPGKDRVELELRQKNALACVNEVAKQASDSGIVSAFHPNSPEGSVFRTAEDYKVMLSGLDYRHIGYCPDSGHIAKGGMDVRSVFEDNASQIRHVHFKDISSSHQWRTMGNGIIDHSGIVKMLRDIEYDGWVMVEEESAQAKHNPEQATVENGRYVHDALRNGRGDSTYGAQHYNPWGEKDG